MNKTSSTTLKEKNKWCYAWFSKNSNPLPLSLFQYHPFLPSNSSCYAHPCRQNVGSHPPAGIPLRRPCSCQLIDLVSAISVCCCIKQANLHEWPSKSLQLLDKEFIYKHEFQNLATTLLISMKEIFLFFYILIIITWTITIQSQREHGNT